MEETLEDVAGREDELADGDLDPLETLDVDMDEDDDALVEDLTLLALELRALLVCEELDDGREEKTGDP